MHYLAVLIICASILLALQIKHTECARILAICPFAGPSQYIFSQPYLKALAERGHEVYVVSAFPQKQKINNFYDIPVLEVLEGYEDIIRNMTAGLSMLEDIKLISAYFTNVTLAVLRNVEFQQFLHSGIRIDLVIVEVLQNDALFGVAQHFNAPIIGISTFGTAPTIDELVGNPSPVSYTPLATSDLTDNMNFWQRLQNLIGVSMELLLWHTIHLPQQVKFYEEFFPDATVDLLKLRKNVSLILLNQHFSLSFPRPYVPNMIEVGGMHINHKPSALPADMEAFINGWSKGVIYFSMGSNVKSKNLPKEALQMLLDTFASLEQGVMWKFEDDNLPGKPENVFISKWFPQPDILAHRNVKLFITHAGLLSTIEAIFHGKPVVCMPTFYDQFLNAARVEKMGFGLSVNLRTLNAAVLKTTIKRVLEEPCFSQKALTMSRLYHDKPMKPLDTAIYWTEYVLRHRGTTSHMRVAAQDLNFLQYHSFDTIAVLYGGLASIAFIIIYVLFKITNIFFDNKKDMRKTKLH